MPQAELSLWIALAAGLASFFSPCVLPLVPTYMAYITGYSVNDMSTNHNLNRKWILTNALLFILGFSVVFILFGLSASFFGRLLLFQRFTLQKIAGVVVILFGLHKIGLVTLRPLLREKRWSRPLGKASLINSLLLGIAFSLGWTPCVGPVLGTILVLAGTEANLGSGALLLITYSFGLAIPFFLTALGISSMAKYLGKVKPYLGIIEILSGVLLIIVGVLVYTNYFQRLAILLS